MAESKVKLICTSTPKDIEMEKKTILRDRKWNNIVGNEEISKIEIDSAKFKENVRRKRSKKYNDHKYERNSGEGEASSKRRNQAIEAMKIAEQRRLRQLSLSLSSEEEEKLAEDFEKINLSTKNEYLPDGRFKLTKKQLTARRLKRQRILKHLAEQEFRNKNKKQERKSVSFREPLEWTPRPKFEIGVNPNVFRWPPKPIASTRLTKLASVPVASVEAFFNEKHEEFEEASIICDENEQQVEVSIMRYVNSEHVQDGKIIRYSKEQLREMNPYGIYFM